MTKLLKQFKLLNYVTEYIQMSNFQRIYNIVKIHENMQNRIISSFRDGI